MGAVPCACIPTAGTMVRVTQQASERAELVGLEREPAGPPGGPQAPPRRRYVNRWMLGLLIAVVACHVLGLLDPRLGADEGVFLVIGRDVAAGRLPYRDAWDNKAPGIYAVTLGLTRLPLPLGGLRCLSALAWLAAFAGLGAALRVQARRELPLLLLYAAAVILESGIGGQHIYTEHWEASCLVAALALALVASRRPPGLAHGVWSAAAGAALGVAIVFRPTALLYAPVVGWLAGTAQGPDRRFSGIGVGAVAGGLGLVIAAAAGALGALGILHEGIEQGLAANSQVSSGFGLRETIQNWRTLTVHLMLVAFAIALAASGLLARRATPQPRLFAACGVAVAIAFLEALAPRKNFTHYLLPLAYFLVPLGWAAILSGGLSPSPRRSNVSLTALGLLVPVAATWAVPRALATVREWASPAPVTVHGVDLGTLRAHYRPGDTVWCGGAMAGDLYWYLDASPASRFLYTESAATQFVDGAIVRQGIARNRPSVVLLVDEWLDEEGRPSQRVPIEVRELLAADYALIQRGSPYESASLFVRRTALPASQSPSAAAAIP